VLYAGLAWIVALACAAVVWRRAQRLSALELPSVDTLLGRLGPDELRNPKLARAELDEWLSDVDGATRVGSELARALSRVTLASGTALALLALLSNASAPPWAAVFSAFLAGIVGVFATGFFGRVAEKRARAAREHWTHVVRRVWSKVETEGSGRT